MADLAPALRKVLRHEGVEFLVNGEPVPGRTGLVNHPDDPGGETNYGITRAEATANGWPGPMADIPFDLVRTIYRTRYWDKIRGDEIADQQIAEELFDTAVNCGVGTAVKFLQRTLNALNRRGERYDDVPTDGVLGTLTVRVLDEALAIAPWYRLVILRALDSLQCVRYIVLAESDPKFESFVPGWIRARVGVPD